MLSGLAYLHVVAKQAHLDIKPENVLINSRGYVKLSDFGLSRSFEETQHFMKTFVGTMTYMSPERIMVSGIHTRASITIQAAISGVLD